MFYPINDVDFRGSTVVVPSISIGNVAQLAMDLLISSLKPILVGHIIHDDLIPIVGPNAYDENSSQISTSCEVYYLKRKKRIYLQVRGAIISGREQNFCNDLIKWMISFNGQSLMVLMSVSAEIRKDKDLEGCQLRYALPSALKKDFEDNFINNGLSEYDNPEEIFESGKVQLCVPSGGFGQYLYEIGNKEGLPSMGVLMYAYEGDNEREARSVAEAVSSIQRQRVKQWQKPISWNLLYGGGPPPNLY